MSNSNSHNRVTIGPARLICVAISADGAGENSLTEAISAAKQAESSADVIEIRLDSISNPQITPFIDTVNKPLLFTNRPSWEGGAFAGSEEKRIIPLIEAIQAGAAFVDIELETAPHLQEQLFEAVQGTRSRLIISWHNFSETPSAGDLSNILQRQYDSGAHIGKIVTTAHDFKDVLRVLDLQVQAAERRFPLIAFCMGRTGVISRLATMELGGFMTYAAPDGGRITAPGQLSASVIRDMLAKFSKVD